MSLATNDVIKLKQNSAYQLMVMDSSDKINYTRVQVVGLCPQATDVQRKQEAKIKMIGKRFGFDHTTMPPVLVQKSGVGQ